MKMRKTKQVRLSVKAHKLLQFMANEKQMTMSKLVDSIVKWYVLGKVSKDLK